MKNFTLSVADGVRQTAYNKKYSNHAVISSLEELRRAVMFDHTAGLFKNDERSCDNFINADCFLMDCDNDHSEAPEKWLTPDTLQKRLPNVEFAVVFSKSHMQDKEKYSARPRFHVYFVLSEHVEHAERIRELKERLLSFVPEFDGKAKDAARFFFGVNDPKGQFFNGTLCIDEFLAVKKVDMLDDEPTMQSAEQKVKQGGRNDYIFRTGLDAITHYGETKARKIFDAACERCDPPLSVAECNRTWESIIKYRNSFKSKYEVKKKVLTPNDVERTLTAFNISVQLNVITKDIEVSDLPQGNAYVPASYYGLPAIKRRAANADLLPLFLTAYLRDESFTFSESFLLSSIQSIALTHSLNPVLNMIAATNWDGEDRIAYICRVLGIQDNEHYCGFVRKWLHQAVSLALNDDGAMNSEFVLVLQGAQGLGKTNLFRRLAIKPEWFVEGAVIDMRNKDSIIESTECWICELGELDSTLKKEQASLKAFITRNFDTYRRPYARKADKIERRTCFCGTVNPDTVNRDATGSRRFIYIHIDAIDKNSVYNIMTPEWVSQLWRQVYDTLYIAIGRDGFYLTDEERAFAETSNEAFRVLLPVETELLDLIDFEECYNIDHEDNTPYKVFKWYTASEVKELLKLNRYSAEQVGAALRALCERYPHCDRKRSHGRTSYLLPPVHDMRND